jgi:hypothetical protein
LRHCIIHDALDVLNPNLLDVFDLLGGVPFPAPASSRQIGQNTRSSLTLFFQSSNRTLKPDWQLAEGHSRSKIALAIQWHLDRNRNAALA